ncbi:c-type cytochrome biogenesis protein CcmI [Oleomonas cavernae]|uniref:C-type cytochrome biogenesis protein CcmI n=1 Tax=Oleomonas cavernae TaxID=2320859 RepID=A0A418WTH8_9PROT|nr:c-type cytochrome biogenesis protein CcmI [Oleomonas cavernae]RJF94476.1 c-type cytochrome biogenesis protein CcmI [Oleomonas cavernae]
MMVVAFALVAAAVAILLLRPLLRPGAGQQVLDAERAVYRAQLDELEAERAAGMINDAEAAGARLEIERRLLKTARGQEPSRRLKPSLALALVVALGVPGGAALLYEWLGAAGMPDRPLAERLTTQGQDAEIARLIAELEARMAANPGDPQGWMLLARARAAQGKLIPAAEAYEKIAGLVPDSVQARLAAAELRIAAADGQITPQAKALIDQALALAPQDPSARHFAAYAKFAGGDLAGAVADWQALLPTLAADDPLRNAVIAGLAAAGQPVAPTAPAPTADDMAAAQDMSPAERQAMIEGMVGRLADRLKDNPQDLEGWTRLARAYDVLGRKADAVAAWEKAVALAPGNAELEAGLDAARSRLP